MLLGKLEKDGSRKVGRFCPWCLCPLLTCCVSVTCFCQSRAISFCLCFTFLLWYSLSLLCLGVSVSHHISYMLRHPPLSSILFHCHGSKISSENFTEASKVSWHFSAAICKMWCLRIHFLALKFASPCVSSHPRDGTHWALKRCYNHILTTARAMWNYGGSDGLCCCTYLHYVQKTAANVFLVSFC